VKTEKNKRMLQRITNYLVVILITEYRTIS